MNRTKYVRARGIVAGTLTAILLAACGTTPPGADGALAPVWERDVVLATLDLSELGAITVADDGTFLLGGKRLPDDLPRDLPYGRDLNLLRVDDEALNSLPLTTRDAFLFSGPEVMRGHIEEVGVSREAVRAAMRDGGVQSHELRQLVRERPSDVRLRTLLTGSADDR